MNDVARAALVSAGRTLAARGIHGAFSLARKPAVLTVSFSSSWGSRTDITREALYEAARSLRAAGFEADVVADVVYAHRVAVAA